MPKPTKNLFFTLALVAASSSFFLLTGLEIAKRYTQPQIIQTQPTVQSTQKSIILPIHLKIKTASIQTPIMASSKIWEEDAKIAVYFLQSPLPGQIGNSIIYGHNWPNILGKLNKVKTGDLIQIDFSDGSYEKFKIVQKVNVTADQTHILNPSKDARITIYTCSGILDTKRLVVVATKI